MVAPLLARYNDPDLTEAEQVALSTHLLQCPACLAQVHSYRTLDDRVRSMHSMVIASRVRDAVLETVAASNVGMGGTAIAIPWRHAWSGMAVMFSLTAILLAVGLTTALAAQHSDVHFGARTMSNGVLVRPVTTTLLNVNANPTQTARASGQVVAFKRPIMQAHVQAQATRPAAVAATIRSVDFMTGRIVVSVGGARGDERLVIKHDTAIVHPDGRPGRITDLAAGLQVQLQREADTTGGLVAREIMLR
jgi:anti-sigma factor RsiW